MRTRANTQPTASDSLNIKMLVLGVGSVGKSSLLLRFTDQQWLPEGEMEATIGVDTYVGPDIVAWLPVLTPSTGT